jgi:NADPH2:quinone reductase
MTLVADVSARCAADKTLADVNAFSTVAGYQGCRSANSRFTPLGARVIGTVSTDAKARAARAAGCDAVIVGRDYRFAASVHDATGGRGADVIYDGLGQAAACENLDALAMCGHWISYGQASGPVDRLAVDSLHQKSATFSSPVLFHYTADRTMLTEIVQRTFEALRQGTLRLDIQHRYPLSAAARAHSGYPYQCAGEKS